jgi:hypothetical protein
MGYKFFADQRMGSEYGGVQYQARQVQNTVQPKVAEALTGNERLRLGYLTGQDDNSMSLEDLRQFVGLRHSDGRPSWFVTGQPYGPTYGEAWQDAQRIIDATQNWM